MNSEWCFERFRALAADVPRVVLVTLGIVWGVLSLTVVLSFGAGFQRAANKAVRAGGRHLVRVWSGSTTKPWAGLHAGRWIGLLPGDVRLIRRQVPHVYDAAYEFSSFGNDVDRDERRVNARVMGVSPSYAVLCSCLPAAGGRFINLPDEEKCRQVAFLGWEVKEQLFGRAPAVGRMIRIWGQPFRVIGVMRRKTAFTNYEGMDREKIFIPGQTFSMLRGRRHVSYLLVGAVSPEKEQAVLEGLYRVLGKHKGFDCTDSAALQIGNQIATDRMIHNVFGSTRVLMGVVGFLGLLVAFIGVANVMIVMVEERKREIGIQMALGARPALITGNFFFEGMVTTVTGGVIGICASSAVLWGMNLLPVDPAVRGYLGHPELSVGIALMVTACLGAAGTAAGYFPARRAARLDPVEALYEE